MASWKTHVAGVEMLHLNIILYTASTPLIKRVEKFYKLHNRIFHHSDSVWMILLPVLHVCVSRSVISDSLWPHELQPAKLLCPWDSPGKNTGMGCHFLLQRIFLTQGLNSGLMHCTQILYQLSHQGSPWENWTKWICQHWEVGVRSCLSFLTQCIVLIAVSF